MDISLPNFLKVKPLFFVRSDVLEKPQIFLDSMDKICSALRCSSTRAVELAEFRLDDVS